MNNQPNLNSNRIWKAFGNIECMLIQRFYNLYLASEFAQKYQLVNMGKFTVDLKHMKLFVTMDKDNSSHYKLVMQGSDHIRPRPDGNGRFSAAIPTERDGAQGWSGRNFLGKAWTKKTGKDFPSLNEVFKGIMMEAKIQLIETSGCPVGSQMLQEAIDNICATW
jgi:hypothetical protein